MIGIISDPAKFIDSHLSIILGKNFSKKGWAYKAYYDRLKEFCEMEGIDFEDLLESNREKYK